MFLGGASIDWCIPAPGWILGELFVVASISSHRPSLSMQDSQLRVCVYGYIKITLNNECV